MYTTGSSTHYTTQWTGYYDPMNTSFEKNMPKPKIEIGTFVYVHKKLDTKKRYGEIKRIKITGEDENYYTSGDRYFAKDTWNEYMGADRISTGRVMDNGSEAVKERYSEQVKQRAETRRITDELDRIASKQQKLSNRNAELARLRSAW